MKQYYHKKLLASFTFFSLFGCDNNSDENDAKYRKVDSPITTEIKEIEVNSQIPSYDKLDRKSITDKNKYLVYIEDNLVTAAFVGRGLKFINAHSKCHVVALENDVSDQELPKEDETFMIIFLDHATGKELGRGYGVGSRLMQTLMRID